MVDLSRWLTGGMVFVNQVLAATIVLTSFSLLIYLLTHNLRSAVARAFCALLFFVLIVYGGDVALVEVSTKTSALHWLQFQWIGIAMVPAAYLDFSDALLRTTYARVRWRRVLVVACYAVSLALLGLVFFSNLLVYDGIYSPQSSHLAPGPLFWLFVLYFAVTVIWGAVNVRRARQRCLTRASRRRMTYLGLAFVAPAAGVFPYLMLANVAPALPDLAVLLLLFVGNVAVLTMLVMMAYSVAYFGAITPDRVIRHNLIHYLLRGPVVGAAVIFVMLAVPKVQAILGLPRDTVLIFAVVGVIVALQLAINRAKPFIDRAIYRQDREEVGWIQTLDRRLLTSADLRGLLENTLAALCDLLRVRTGFVASQAGPGYRLEAHCGNRAVVERFLESHDRMAPGLASARPSGAPFFAANGFWILPLRGKAGDPYLGILGVEARTSTPDLDPAEQQSAALLVGHAQEALEDRILQQGVFDTLSRILPEIERLQRWQDATRYVGAPAVPTVQPSPVDSPQFERWVKDALGHYWGGPRLTSSPLLALRLVREAVREQGDAPAQALRTALTRAIESLRPEGEQRMTAAEWMLYNILDLKFIRGLRVQDISRRLAMSESDLYRKQRVAIAEVARALSDHEQASGEPAEHQSPVAS